MPKEYINTNLDDGGVTVAWGRGTNYTQVSIEGPLGWRKSLPEEADLDWWLTLTTKIEIDRLIKALKKARKQAFGGEE